jgi:hypothetical protein
MVNLQKNGGAEYTEELHGPDQWKACLLKVMPLHHGAKSGVRGALNVCEKVGV